jgi:hypothetical protein
MTPVHMSAMLNKTEIINCVISPSNINMQDQVSWVYIFLNQVTVVETVICCVVLYVMLCSGALARFTTPRCIAALRQCTCCCDTAQTHP